MLYSEIIAVCSEIHTKHINTICGQNVELLSVKHGGTYSDYTFKGCCANMSVQDILFSYESLARFLQNVLRHLGKVLLEMK
jgi:hypothetical protein